MINNISMNEQHESSFRDPAGYIYKHEGTFYRFVSDNYTNDYDFAQQKGLYSEAVKQHLLLPFKEINEKHIDKPEFYKTLLPEQLAFLTYPWEWCFAQYKNAALTTLSLNQLALNKGMILKDATPLNIQLVNGHGVWIDHLSFEIYDGKKPWIAYRQFCEMFLNPLLIASYCRVDVNRLSAAYPSGITATQTAAVLPFKSRFNIHVQLHVFLQARVQQKRKEENKQAIFSREKLERVLDSLKTCIQSLTYRPVQTVWSDYYEETILSKEYLEDKKRILSEYLNDLNYQTVFDAGCNDGTFSLLCKKDALVVSADGDASCINRLYEHIKENKIEHVNPVVLDLMQPTGGMGWDNREQDRFFERKEFDLILGLALMHHLCIGKNLPFTKLAAFLATHGRQLLIEYIPKDDPKVVELLRNRQDIFYAYDRYHFEKAFDEYFRLEKATPIGGTRRLLYKMTRI